MCGLAGMAGLGIISKDLDILKDLSHISALRGTDSTGILQANVRKRKVISSLVEKDNVDISYFSWFHARAKEGNRKVFDEIKNTVFALHVRAATRGSLTKENAHPFELKNIIGMHNGTLWDSEFHDSKRTDSEMMFRKMDKEGIIPVLKNLSDKSAYAIVIMDKNTGELIFARNSDRPLWFCMNEDRDVMYWASEKWMLKGIMERRDQKIKDNAIYTLGINKIYKIDPDKIDRKNKAWFKEEDFSKVEAEKNEQSPIDKPRRDYSVISAIPNKPGNPLGKIPVTFCCSCHKKLTLVETYFSHKYASNTVVCQECTNVFNTIN